MRREGYVAGFALALCCAGLFGQTVASSLEGTVADPANAVVVDATVRLISAETGAARTGTTDSNGTYRFLNLRPGIYNVTIAAPGFKNETKARIVVAGENPDRLTSKSTSGGGADSNHS